MLILIQFNNVDEFFMKYFYFLLLFAVFTNSSKAQNYNLGFEDWFTNITPSPVSADAGLNTCHPYIIGTCYGFHSATVISNNSILTSWSAQPNGILRTTDSHTGTYATIVNMWYNGARGVLAFGNSTDVYANIPKVQFNNKIYGVSGVYKYKRDIFIPNDTLKKRALLNIATYKINTQGILEQISRDSLMFNPTDNYTNFSLPINYSNTNVVPDSVSIWFESKGYNSGTTSCGLSHFLYLDDLQFHFTPLSTNKIEHLKFKIFPNPANETITIEYSSNITVKKIQLVDLSGRIVKTFTNTKDKILYVNDLSKGNYLLTIHTPEGSFSEKIILK